jgi:hypothetical protein
MRNFQLLVMVTVVMFFASCDEFSQQSADPLNYIPEDSPLILETNNLLPVWNTYAQSSIWGVRKENKGFNRIYRQMQQLVKLGEKHPKIASAFAGNKTFIATTVDGDFQANLLLSTASSLSFKDIESIIQNDFGSKASITHKSHLEIPVHQIIFSEEDAVLNFAFESGVLLLSYDFKTITRALEQSIKKSHLPKNNRFAEIRSTSGEYSDGTLLVNFSKLPNLLLSGSYSKYSDLMESLSAFAGWAALDLTAKKDKLILNGFTMADSSDYLSAFAEEGFAMKPQNHIPASAALAVIQNFDSGEAWMRHLQKKSRFDEASRKFKANENLFQNLSGKSILILDQSALNNVSNNTSVVLYTGNGAAALKGIEQMAKRTGKSFYDKTGDDGKRVLRMPSEDFFRNLFGKLFTNIESPYFTIHEDLLIASSNLNHLLETLRKIENNDVLANDDTFSSLSNGFSGNANLMVYARMQPALQLASGMNKNIEKAYRENTSALENIAGFTAEFSNTGKYHFTSIYASSGEKLRSTQESSWELKLDAEVIGTPQIVNDHLSTEKRIIAFDALNNMYFISHDGKILWKHTLSGRPLGKVHEVDAYSNNKVQYLLNTENHLYLIDVLGRDVENYPVKIDAKATNPVAVFNYNGYRLMLAGADQKIYAYDIEGNEVAGWEKPRTPGEVVTPMQHLVFAGRDYLFATAKNGNLLIANRRGNTRVSMRDKIVNAYHSRIFVNRTNSKAPFITTGISGALKYIKLNGRTAETKFEQFSNDHYFFYERFNEDRHYDFIYFDKGRVVIYDRFKNVLYENNFGDHVYTQPEIISYRNNTALKFTSLSDSKCYLITKDGLVEDISGPETTTSCAVGQLKRYGKTTVIAGNEKKLVKYLLP